MPLSLHKPRDQAEYQILDYLSRYPEKNRDTIKLKKRNERYNRIYSIIVACKNQNTEMMNYLLGNEFQMTKDQKAENTFKDNDSSLLVHR